MRRELKYAIGLGVFIIAAGAWFMNSVDQPSPIADAGKNAVPDAEEADAEIETLSPISESFGMAEDTAASETREEEAASPMAEVAPQASERSFRPTPAVVEESPVAVETSEPTSPDPADADPVSPWINLTESLPSDEQDPDLIVETVEIGAEIAGAGRTHEIVAGDNFSKLAVQYLGSSKHTALILKANPDVDPRRLQVGMKIRIPAAPHAAPAAATETSTAGAKPAIPPDRAYTVQEGETWYDLGKKFLGNPARSVELYEFNRERVPRNPNVLPAGTVIELPPEARKRG